ncbi:MAG TPA: HPr family phosphocarrier protein [Microbacteriaceae bacterium]|nr:HPr family phosphocarrier protein [Microbacteriaceae bacterium]
MTVGSRVGLHARPASLFVQAVGGSGHEVTISKASGDSADGASILAVLALAVSHGDSLELVVEGDDAERVADELAAVLASDLDA